MGMRAMRHKAAAVEAQAVLTGMGRSRVEALESRRESMPELAAVSPNRDRGPWNKAGP